MNRNIQVSVLGIQDFGCGSETVSTRAYGQYDFQNGLHKVSYCELDSNGTATDNMLIISESELKVNRSGSLSGRLLFNLEHRTKAEYVTSFGKFDFDIETDLYTLSENENGLGIELKYRLYEGKNLFSENTPTVQIYESSSDSLRSINITRRNNL